MVERLGVRANISFSQDSKAFHGVGAVGDQQVQLVLPQTWMNQSGVVVNDIVHRFEVPASNLIIVYDDLDLNFGNLRIKTQGGAGGHNGVRSILSNLTTDQFCRLKIGIGHPPPGIEIADYVLSHFSSDEVSYLEKVLLRAVDALESIVLHGPSVAMNKYNAQFEPEESL